MKTLVLYDSEYGKTQEIAEAIGEVLERRMEVEVVQVSEVEEKQLADVDFLVIGSPTQRFNPTPAVNEWIKAISPESLQGVKVAAFDTRFTEEEIGKSPVLAFLSASLAMQPSLWRTSL